MQILNSMLLTLNNHESAIVEGEAPQDPNWKRRSSSEFSFPTETSPDLPLNEAKQATSENDRNIDRSERSNIETRRLSVDSFDEAIDNFARLQDSNSDRKGFVDSINWLVRHVPQCVLRRLTEEILFYQDERDEGLGVRRKSITSIEASDPMSMPHGTQYDAALLFIDMSGFTVLSQKLDVESFSKAINSYFETIVDEVTSRGGDILKFAGDAMFVEWRAGQQFEGGLPAKKRSMCSSLTTERKSNTLTLDDCVYAAAVCGAMVVKKCADSPVYSKSSSSRQGEQVATLNVHCGLGVGKMGGVHVGNDHSRRLYLVIGEPIDQVSEACDSAKLGEIRASKEALKYLNKGQPAKHKLKCDKDSMSKIIASKEHMYFKERTKNTWTLSGRVTKPKKPIAKFVIPFEDLDLSSLKVLKKMLSLYVHPCVITEGQFDEGVNDAFKGNNTRVKKKTRRNSLVDIGGMRRNSVTRTLRTSINSTDSSLENANAAYKNNRASLVNMKTMVSTRERLRSEAELRSVFTIFIKPNIEVNLTNDLEKSDKQFNQLNDIMNTVTGILDELKGQLLQFIVDDKGVVLIGTFGLRGSTFPNMVPERALPTCRLIHSELAENLGIDSNIGATLGKVYCGVVGGVERHEFSVLGASVNLAARLMAQKNHPGIMVDGEVHKQAQKINFIAFPPVKAKGYTDLVPVYKPLTAKETRWGKVDPNFVGRKEEMRKISTLALKMSRRRSPSKIIFIWGDSGSGKSSFVVHTISNVYKSLVSGRKKTIITRNLCADGDTLVPFSLFRSIFRDVLREKAYRDDVSIASSVNKDEQKDLSDKEAIIRRLQQLCQQLNAPEGLMEIIGHHLLGDSKLKMSKVEKGPDLADTIDFMAKIFLKATSHADLVVLALDDVQWLDNLSWKVVQCIFEESENVLIVCASRPLESFPLTMDDTFWDSLTGQFSDHFSEEYLGPLKKIDVLEMAAITLSCKSEDIEDEVVNDVYMSSGGMPHFVSEILSNCIKNDRMKKLHNNKIGWNENYKKHGMQFANLDELMLQRVDNLSELARKVLHFASILGSSFDFEEILEISGHILAIPPEDLNQHSIDIHFALESAVEEGILDETLEEEEKEDGLMASLNIPGSSGKMKDSEKQNYEYRVYTFHHSSWQRLVLSLLLDSWKRDIHKHAAMAIEANWPDAESRDYRTKVKLFQHWKESDNSLKASDLALDIGQSYKMLGLNQHSITVYENALEIWRKHTPDNEESLVAGYAPQVLESLDAPNLVLLIKLQTALGQAVGSTLNQDKKESAKAFQDALKILEDAPVSAEIKDRAFIFPIFSGMFFLLKYGVLSDPSETASYEVDLVGNFVKETKKHGDPIHYGRALAMQGETYHRQGLYKEAIESHMELKRVYDVKKHHALVVASYASDRVGQNFGCTANCYMRLENVDMAMKIVDHIINNLMPKMDPKNVHNSIVTIYPAIWILKDNGKSEKAREIFMKFVLEPFTEYFGEDGSTPFLPAFRGLEILLDLVVYMEGKASGFDEGYYDWALDFSNLEIKKAFDSSIGNFGRNSSSTNAEICLRLYKLTDDSKKKVKLLENGMKIAEQAIHRCDGSDGSSKMLTTYLQIKPVHDELKQLDFDDV
eukprot:CAMPEP_0194101608 /NCGR_PEP_ID=MMETSP0150-20130528/2290_1 /TAXON_ID=122233 /ORGANISM="Chaetoceros debilis, Strain MM31A-1" /LENGTH=1615 /DNA_ID=CAMNT_0038788273 /DNA_START=63 /DNA_END=4907 /DNA_ORIENTATION=-